jgi:DNA-binding SARP family transcriptional activator
VAGGLTYRVLGPLTVSADGQVVRLGGPKERLALAVLLLNAGRVVSSDRLVDILWGEAPPGRALATLQVHISNLRKRLEPRHPGIITQPPGYLVPVTERELDLIRFERLVGEARDRGRTSLEEAADTLDRALKMWAGPAVADLESNAFVESTRAFLEERRLGAEEDRLDILLALSRHQEALLMVDRILEEHPLREALWAKRILALYRLGRQGEALAAFRRCREMLMDELGVEPTPALRALEGAILNQDPLLDPPEAVRPGDAAYRSTHAPAATATFLAKGPAQARLVCSDGTAIPLDGVVVLGRNDDCDVVLPDRLVSRRHAEIRPALGGHLLTDLMSSNGTVVGTERVTNHLLRDGDLIHIGEGTLRYETA